MSSKKNLVRRASLKFFFVTALAFSSGLTIAAEPKKPVVAPSTPATTAPTAGSGVTDSTSTKATQLWDSWYTVKVGGSIPFGYYHDRVEIKDGKIAFQNQYWKNEEGSINEEQLIAFAENTDNLTPVLFQFKSFYRDSTIDLDGTMKSGILKVKIRKNSKEIPSIERSVAKKAFLSSHFPIYLGKHLKKAKKNTKQSFSAILEDQVQRAYQPVSGHYTLQEADEFAKKTKTNRIAVHFNDQEGIWYVHDSGQIERIELKGNGPGTNILVEKAEEAIARRFLMADSLGK